MFSTYSENCIAICQYIYDIISLFAVELEKPKIGIWRKALKSHLQTL